MEDDTAVDDSEILAVFAERESPLRAPEVAEDLPIGVGDLRDRFDDLAERDLLRQAEDRQSGTAWYVTDAGEAVAADDDAVVTNTEAQATATGTQSTARDQETPATQPPKPDEAESNPPYERPDSEIETFDPPGTPEQKAVRRAALRAAYDYLREHGSADRLDFVEDVFPNAPGAFEDPTDGWWSEVVEPGLVELPGAEPVEGSGGERSDSTDSDANGDAQTSADAWRFDENATPIDG